MVIGIDLGGMSAKGAMIEEGALIGKSRVVTHAESSAEETARDLVALCYEVAQKAGKRMEEVEAIGIGSPGVIDSANGTVVFWSNFHWKHVPLAQLISERLKKPVFITNDANAAALGEATYGAGKKFQSSILVTLGTGVGGGIVLNHKLFEGFQSAGGEIGHMTIKKDGETCTCGRKGCFEYYASATGLIRATKKKMQENPESLMWKLATSLEGADGRTAFDGMRAGDKCATEVVDQYVSDLSDGIANLVNLLRPQAILLGGGVSAEGEFLLSLLREKVADKIYVDIVYAPLELLCAELGNDAGIYGAAQYAMDRLS